VGQEKVEGKARSEAHPMGQGLMAGARVVGYGLEGNELGTAAEHGRRLAGGGGGGSVWSGLSEGLYPFD
jgi:hypothetical protein